MVNREKIVRIKEATSNLTKVNNLNEITPAMVHSHVNAENDFREHIVDALDKHVEESASFWGENTNQLENIKLSMEQKIDKMYVKIDKNSEMTKEALDLARNVNDTLRPLIEKITNHEGRLDDLDLKKAELKGSLKVILWVMTAISLTGTSMYYLYIQNIKTEIKNEIREQYQGASVSAVEERPNSGIYKIRIIEK